MKTGRRKSRADALQILYQLDLNHHLSPQAGMLNFEKYFSPTQTSVDDFARRLINGVMNSLREIDDRLKKVSENWKLDRMPAVDRNILRIGTYELEFCDDIPANVTINEMVEIAKEFGAENTPGFVNGVLDKVRLTLNRPNKVP